MIITGGGSGIGAATACRMAAEGATVAVLDRQGDAAAEVAAEVDGIALTVDVAKPAATTAAIAAAADQMGGVTDLFANAGTGMLQALHTYSDEEWELLIGVNLTGVFNCVRAVLPLLAEAGGSIVTTASSVGVSPTQGEGPYAAAKAGVISLTKSVAREYGPRVRANCVSPAFIRTPLTELVAGTVELRETVDAATPLARIGEADEVADVLVFLCSDAASYVTGQNIVIDGGAALTNAQVDSLLSPFVEPALKPWR